MKGMLEVRSADRQFVVGMVDNKFAQDPSARGFAAAQDDACFRFFGESERTERRRHRTMTDHLAHGTIT